MKGFFARVPNVSDVGVNTCVVRDAILFPRELLRGVGRCYGGGVRLFVGFRGTGLFPEYLLGAILSGSAMRACVFRSF